jgi:hypothetical protein
MPDWYIYSSSMNINNNENLYLRIAYLSGFNMGMWQSFMGIFYGYRGEAYHLWALYIDK